MTLPLTMGVPLGLVTLSAVNDLDIPIAAVVPLVVLWAAFVGYCLFDISRSQVKHLPKWVWAIICVVSVPFGGIIYLFAGREPTGK